MRSLWLVALLVPTAVFRPPSVDALDERVRAPRSGDLVARLADVTDVLVGAPYVLNALGEGEGAVPDSDPLFRLDAFDCTTFVETAMALAFARDVAEAKALLTFIRYRDGRVGYLERRHFPEAEWIPELEALGFLEDVTAHVGGAAVVQASKAIDVAVWHRNRFKKTPWIPDERIPSGVFSLPILPLAEAQRAPEAIPAGTVLHVVRHDFRSVPVRVSHQALVLEKDGRRVVRHASDLRHRRVVDEPIEAFLAALARDRKWPVTGLHISRIVEPSDWRTLLPAPSLAASSG